MLDIIDSHVHITENGKWMDTNYDSSLKNLLNEIHLASVNKAILVAIEGVVKNDYIAEIASEYSEIFYAFCSVNPAIIKFEDFFKNKNDIFIGLKIHPRFHNYSLKNNDVIRFFKNVEKIPNFIVMVDCWFSDSDSINLIREYINFFNNFKNIRFILAHSGGFQYNLIIPLAIEENCYLDLSYTPFILKKYRDDLYNDFFSKLRLVNSSKLLFGSDFPEFSIKKSISLLKETLKIHNYSQSEQRKIFYSNINNLVKSV